MIAAGAANWLLACAVLLIVGASAHALERASYDSAGKLTGLIHDGGELEVRGQFAN